MKKQVVLITGGSSGIGRSIGHFLKEKGMVVYGTSRDRSKYPDFDDFHLISMDVRQPESIKSAIEDVVAAEGAIDVLINNAGVGITGPLEEIPADELKNQFAVNFFGPLDVIRAVLPQMRKQKSGLIINITSIAAFMGLPFRGPYSASKGALEIITESLRMELRSFGIRVTNLAPGDFATNIAAGRYHAPVKNDSPYREAYKSTLELMNQHVDSGKHPDLVAEKVYGIIQSKHPKIHYKVGGWFQKFSVSLKKILPDKVFERLLLNHYKL